MFVLGKIVGFVLGYMAGGLAGGIIGALVGHFFDRGLSGAMRFDYRADRAAAEQAFFETAFTVTGALAKADGRISETEIAAAEQMMARLRLTAEHRREAIALFKRGASPEFELEQQLQAFRQSARRAPLLPPLLLEFLFGVALADGELHPAEQDILRRVAAQLGIGARQFDQLLAMLRAQQGFRQRAGEDSSAGPGRLAEAYAALGLTESASDAEVKRAYRKLMSRHHPDKLIAQGVPEDMVQLATEKSQEIQTAYGLVREARGMR